MTRQEHEAEAKRLRAEQREDYGQPIDAYTIRLGEQAAAHERIADRMLQKELGA